MHNPVLRQNLVPQPSVSKFLQEEKWQSILSEAEEFANYQHNLDPHYNSEQVTEELINLANLFGYQ